MSAVVNRMLTQAQGRMHDVTAHAHQAEPGGALDYILVFAGAVIVLMVCVFTVKYLMRPGERSPRHIKSRILRDDF